jgi:tetratricopeptide (TPR) repeat protein
MFKLFTFVLNVTLSSFEIPRQMVLIPLIVCSRFRVVPEWVLAMFEMAEDVKPKARTNESKFPPLRWNALKAWETAVRTSREKLTRAESSLQVGSEAPDVARRVEQFIVDGKAFDKACNSAASQAAFQKALELRPKDPEILCSLSKELSDRVFDHDIFHNKPLARKFAAEAAEHAAKAISIAPDRAQCFIAFAVANARLSMFSEVRQKVELTHSIKENLMKALELNPEDDYAYHVLARYEDTMAHVSGILRYLVKKLYGAMEPATVEQAEAYFRKAIEINPKRLIHSVELAKLLYEQKRYDESKELLIPALELEIEDINSVRTKKDGEALLIKLTSKLNRTPSRMSLNRTPSRPRLPRTSSSLSTPGSPSMKALASQGSLIFNSPG